MKSQAMSVLLLITFTGCGTLCGSVMGGEFNGALSDKVNKVNEMKIFCFDGDANFAKTTCRQRPLIGLLSLLGVVGRAAERGRSKSDRWQRYHGGYFCDSLVSSVFMVVAKYLVKAHCARYLLCIYYF